MDQCGKLMKIVFLSRILEQDGQRVANCVGLPMLFGRMPQDAEVSDMQVGSTKSLLFDGTRQHGKPLGVTVLPCSLALVFFLHIYPLGPSI